MLESHGATRMLISFHDVIPGFVFSGVFFMEEYLQNNPEKVRAFMRGLMKACDFIRKDEEKAREWIPKYVHLERDVAMKSALREFTDGREPDTLIIKQCELMIQHNFIDKKVQLDKFIDYSFLPKAVDSKE